MLLFLSTVFLEDYMRALFLTILLLPVSIFSQLNSNLISKSEFNDITINNARFQQIRETYGDQTKLKGLFPLYFKNADIDPDGDFYNYKFEGFRIGFSSLIGSYEYPLISKFEITNSNWIVSINGKTVKVGSHFSELGNVKINNKIDGRKSIVFQYCDGCNNYLSFELDGSGKIMKIIYIEMT